MNEVTLVPAHALALALGCAPAVAQSTTCVSVEPGGFPGNERSHPCSISADGNVVAFASLATDLVAAPDTNASLDIFVRDRAAGVTTRIYALAGAQPNFGADEPEISADGRYVAFASFSSNFVAGDVNAQPDVFVHDRQSGLTTRVSVNSGGAQGNWSSSYPSLSADGRFVAFYSLSTNLVAGDINFAEDVFLHDRQTSVTARVSVATGGVQSDGPFSVGWGGIEPAVSSDGRFVAFTSQLTALVPGDTNGAADVFVHDRTLATTRCLSVNASGNPANAASIGTSMTSDGGLVAFTSWATDLPAASSGMGDAYLFDLGLDLLQLVSVGPGGLAASGNGPRVSLDGRWVAFTSYGSNLGPPDLNGLGDIYLRDRGTGVTRLLSVGSSGAQGNGHSYDAVVDADGTSIAFISTADNLVAGDANQSRDVFVRDLPAHASVAAYCTAGTSSSNCAASIAGSGLPSASASAGFTISVAQVEGQKTGLIFYGVSGTVAVPWSAGSSWLCVKSPTQRTPPQSSGGTPSQCSGLLAIDWNAFAATHPSALGAPFGAGDGVWAQGWYRDPASAKTTGLSDALYFTVQP